MSSARGRFLWDHRSARARQAIHTPVPSQGFYSGVWWSGVQFLLLSTDPQLPLRYPARSQLLLSAANLHPNPPIARCFSHHPRALAVQASDTYTPRPPNRNPGSGFKFQKDGARQTYCGVARATSKSTPLAAPFLFSSSTSQLNLLRITTITKHDDNLSSATLTVSRNHH